VQGDENQVNWALWSTEKVRWLQTNPHTSSWNLESEISTNELNTAIEFDYTLNQYSVQACLPVDFQTCASVGEGTVLWKLMPFTEMQLNP
jgi:hypothetical protein